MNRNNNCSVFILGIMSLAFIITSSAYCQDSTQNVMDVNNITSWVRDDGFHPAMVKGSNPHNNAWNGTFPIETTGAIYTEGVVWICKAFDLSQNDPNPSNPTTIKQNKEPRAAYVRLVVYDILGKEVSTLVDGEKEGGTNKEKNLTEVIYRAGYTFTG